MLHDAFSGFNSTIFAYGQTGSGKTYSMVGVENDPVHEGLLPRICKDLFALGEELMAEDRSLNIKIQVSFVEVYNEKIHDLLQFEVPGVVRGAEEDMKDLKLKENKKTKAFDVEGLSLHTVTNYPRVKSLIEIGTEYRTKAATGMNELSSRSHSVFTITMNQTHVPPSSLHKDMCSKIVIVDLAGSERQSKTDIEDAVRKKEAERINMSLLILGRCLSASAQQGAKGNHVPLRESTLTKMLMDIFGGNSKTMMFATVSPSLFNFAETMSTLQYANNAKKIKHKAKVNSLGKALEIKELKEQVRALGKTLIEELEKAARQKELLEGEIGAITEERDLVNTALTTCQGENEELRNQLETIRAENQDMQNRLQSGDFTGLVLMAEPGTSRSEAGMASAHAADGEETVSQDGTFYQPPVHQNNQQDELNYEEKETALAEIHAELTRKLHICNPSLSSRTNHRPGDPALNEALATGREEVPIRSYMGHHSAVYACAFSPDGENILSASRDRTLIVWQVKTGRELLKLSGHNGIVLSCAYAPNGAQVASASDDKTVKIWDAESGKKLLTLKGHNDRVYCVQFSADSSMLASASCDKTLKVCKLPSQIRTLSY